MQQKISVSRVSDIKLAKANYEIFTCSPITVTTGRSPGNAPRPKDTGRSGIYISSYTQSKAYWQAARQCMAVLSYSLYMYKHECP